MQRNLLSLEGIGLHWSHITQTSHDQALSYKVNIGSHTRIRTTSKFKLDTRAKCGEYPCRCWPKWRPFILEDKKLIEALRHLIRVAEKAQLLLNGLADTAIDALIDEATGYQKRRAHDALQRILAAYVRSEFRACKSKFPISFYEQSTE
jgi:hypothetical protein